MGIFNNWREKALELLIKQIPSLMKGSWRTTLVAIAAGLTLIFNQIINLFDTDPATVFEYSAIVEALALLGIGALARDNKVTSEQANAGK